MASNLVSQKELSPVESLIQEFNWASHPLGSRNSWAQELRMHLSMILAHKFPMILFWGPEFYIFYNDAFVPLLPGKSEVKSPLGEREPNFFTEEHWEKHREALRWVYSSGESLFLEDQPDPESLTKYSHHPSYWNSCFSPIFDGKERIIGVLFTCYETTPKVEAFQNLKSQTLKAQLAMEAANIHYFETNLDNKEYHFSRPLEDIIHSKQDPATLDMGDFLHPDDREIRKKAMREAKETGVLNYKARLVIQGITKWVRVNGKYISRSENQPESIIGIVQDISDKVQREEELVILNKNLELALNQQKALQLQKDEFLQIASHELRAPLTSIKGYGQLVEEILIENELTRESRMLKKLNERINHLHALVENLFDVSKMGADKLEFQNTEFDLVHLLKVLAYDLKFSTLQHTIIEQYGYHGRVFADRDRISQVVTNILSNAIKYSPQDSEILIKTRKLGSFIVVDIKDQGIGIAKEDQEKIFDQFFRTTNASGNMIRGLGLGLYISSEIIKRQGGKIWVESNPGDGSTFSFSLPISKKSI